MATKPPTIDELEAILNADDGPPVKILPDGTIEVGEQKPCANCECKTEEWWNYCAMCGHHIAAGDRQSSALRGAG